ncbi:MAG: DUF2630 family protein [Chloroflexi bacterium]|nr:MAG: DUF2630 family protein [Chloroflexota bacterium]
MNRIQQLSNERQQLWNKAGQRELSEHEYWRVQQINRELTKLWDTYRRQRAAMTWNGNQDARGADPDGELMANAA